MPAATGSRRVVAGVDGSPNSITALHRAVTEARRRLASLDVVLVIPGEPDPQAYAAGLEMLAQLLIQEYPHGLGVPVQRVVEHGDPARTLVHLACGADLLVLGARQCGRRGNLLGGEVVPACLDWATCPMLICAHEGQRAAV
jgi:nucleotide-binding universal stress UspA family protein